MKYYRLEPALEALKKKPASCFGMMSTYPHNPNAPYCLIGHLHMHAFGPKTLHERVAKKTFWLQDIQEAYALPYYDVQALYIFQIGKDSAPRIPHRCFGMGSFDHLVPSEARKRIMLETLETYMRAGIVDYGPSYISYLESEKIIPEIVPNVS